MMSKSTTKLGPSWMVESALVVNWPHASPSPQKTVTSIREIPKQMFFFWPDRIFCRWKSLGTRNAPASSHQWKAIKGFRPYCAPHTRNHREPGINPCIPCILLGVSPAMHCTGMPCPWGLDIYRPGRPPAGLGEQRQHSQLHLLIKLTLGLLDHNISHKFRHQDRWRSNLFSVILRVQPLLGFMSPNPITEFSRCQCILEIVVWKSLLPVSAPNTESFWWCRGQIFLESFVPVSTGRRKSMVS